jgi:hypothetical protein
MLSKKLFQGYTRSHNMSPVRLEIRVLLAINRLLFREALAGIIEAQPYITVPAQVSSVREALRIISLTTPIRCVVIESGSTGSFCADLITLRKSTRTLLIGDTMQLQELEALRPLVAGILSNTSNSGALIEAMDGVVGFFASKDTPRYIPPVVSPKTAVQAVIVPEFREHGKAN